MHFGRMTYFQSLIPYTNPVNRGIVRSSALHLGGREVFVRHTLTINPVSRLQHSEIFLSSMQSRYIEPVHSSLPSLVRLEGIIKKYLGDDAGKKHIEKVGLFKKAASNWFEIKRTFNKKDISLEAKKMAFSEKFGMSANMNEDTALVILQNLDYLLGLIKGSVETCIETKSEEQQKELLDTLLQKLDSPNPCFNAHFSYFLDFEKKIALKINPNKTIVDNLTSYLQQFMKITPDDKVTSEAFKAWVMAQDGVVGGKACDGTIHLIEINEFIQYAENVLCIL